MTIPLHFFMYRTPFFCYCVNTFWVPVFTQCNFCHLLFRETVLFPHFKTILMDGGLLTKYGRVGDSESG